MADPRPSAIPPAQPPGGGASPPAPIRRSPPTTAGTPDVTRIGLDRPRLDDVYHFFLRSRWRVVMPTIVGIYLVINLVFAVGYYLTGGIDNSSGSFADSFFFSVQTLATIGYGKMAPASQGANLLVTFEALLGMIGMAMMTGLVFAKFSRPTAKVMFSETVVLAEHDGHPSLMFRIANTRTSQIVEATIRVSVLRGEITREGVTIRRMHELKLLRSQSAFFALSWLVIHRIDETSPFHGATPESLERGRIQFIASLTGTDETLAQTVHARHTYGRDDIQWDMDFVDIFVESPTGARQIDYTRFHDVRPVARRPA